MSTKVRLIAEIGSCHMGRIELLKEAIDRCKALEIDALKLQLFPDLPKYTEAGNVYVSDKLFLEAFEYGEKQGLTVSASVFDEDSFRFLLELEPKFIKFAYSQKEQRDWIEETLNHDIEAIVSCDVMTDYMVRKHTTTLYCIPDYPVRYEVAFDGLFPRFDGFSDHTLGIRQTQKAIDQGAMIIEKHVRLGYAFETCPDARFAVTIEELAKLHLRKL
jgi:sialic acid synthase SpsE